jgi:hypothetical protein
MGLERSVAVRRLPNSARRSTDGSRSLSGGLHYRWLNHGASRDSILAWYDAARPGDRESTGDNDAPDRSLETLRPLLDLLPASAGVSAVEFCELAKRLDEKIVAAEVALADARLVTPNNPEAPAHADLLIRRLALDGVLKEEHWLLAESWWAETFSAPRFSDLARWGLGVVPWTVGSHFGVRVRRVWSEREHISGAGRQLWWLVKLVRATLSLLGSLVLSLGALIALAILLVLVLLPIPRLRAAVGTLQREIASSLGDSYILVGRPMEATIRCAGQRQGGGTPRRRARAACAADGELSVESRPTSHDGLRRGGLPSVGA